MEMHNAIIQSPPESVPLTTVLKDSNTTPRKKPIGFCGVGYLSACFKGCGLKLWSSGQCRLNGCAITRLPLKVPTSQDAGSSALSCPNARISYVMFTKMVYIEVSHIIARHIMPKITRLVTFRTRPTTSDLRVYAQTVTDLHHNKGIGGMNIDRHTFTPNVLTK